MWKNKGPYRLILNGAASKEIEWHCKHYVGRGLMKHFKSGAELAKELGVPLSKLDATFKEYTEASKSGNDKYGRKYFQYPFKTDDIFHVAIVTPVLHFTMVLFWYCIVAHLKGWFGNQRRIGVLDQVRNCSWIVRGRRSCWWSSRSQPSRREFVVGMCRLWTSRWKHV